MNDGSVSIDEVPTTWPCKLYPQPATYHFDHPGSMARRSGRKDSARYRRDPAKWIAAVQKWRAANPEHVKAYAAWWYLQNRERRLLKMRTYTGVESR